MKDDTNKCQLKSVYPRTGGEGGGGLKIADSAYVLYEWPLRMSIQTFLDF